MAAKWRLSNTSSIHFPCGFGDGHRMVDLTGEAFFEIKKDPSKPFSVQSGTTTVQVLGTRFNIMAYPDEPVGRYTLLQGTIRVIHGKTLSC